MVSRHRCLALPQANILPGGALHVETTDPASQRSSCSALSERCPAMVGDSDAARWRSWGASLGGGSDERPLTYSLPARHRAHLPRSASGSSVAPVLRPTTPGIRPKWRPSPAFTVRLALPFIETGTSLTSLACSHLLTLLPPHRRGDRRAPPLCLHKAGQSGGPRSSRCARRDAYKGAKGPCLTPCLHRKVHRLGHDHGTFEALRLPRPPLYLGRFGSADSRPTIGPAPVFEMRAGDLPRRGRPISSIPTSTPKGPQTWASTWHPDALRKPARRSILDKPIVSGRGPRPASRSSRLRSFRSKSRSKETT